VATLSPAQIYSLAVGAGLSPAAATTATAVALAESGGRTDAMGDVALEDATWGPSVGLWQIRSLKAQQGTGGPRDATRLTDPTFNAASMAQISGTGGNFKPWTTFSKGTYKQFLEQVGSPATTVGGSVAGVLSGIAGAARGESSGSSPGSSSGGSTSTDSYASTLGGGVFDWQPGVFTIAVKIAGAAAAACLVIVGAVHTVKD
jgi:hypothetical protein